jgi:hypothetical protein
VKLHLSAAPSRLKTWKPFHSTERASGYWEGEGRRAEERRIIKLDHFSPRFLFRVWLSGLKEICPQFLYDQHHIGLLTSITGCLFVWLCFSWLHNPVPMLFHQVSRNRHFSVHSFPNGFLFLYFLPCSFHLFQTQFWLSILFIWWSIRCLWQHLWLFNLLYTCAYADKSVQTRVI